MSVNWNDFHVHQARLADMQRRAQQDQLARQVQQPAHPVVRAMLVALGRQMVKVGSQLQRESAGGLAPAKQS